MSDGITEAFRGTYFKDRSKLPFDYDVRKEHRKKPNFWARLINIIKRR